jgi:hexosaminidase
MFKRMICIAALLVSGLVFAKSELPATIEAVSSILSPVTSVKNYSLELKFKVKRNIKVWAIGFYMPRSFNQMSGLNIKAVNPDLVMQVCEGDVMGACPTLKLVQSPAVLASAGYTTVLTPVKPVKLVSGKMYYIRLKNSNQSAPTNYSAMPQSFFLIENNKHVFALADPAPEVYQIGGYHQDQIDLALAKHTLDNWLQAKPREASSLADLYHLVPAPVSIVASQGDSFVLSQKVKIDVKFPNDVVNTKLLMSYLKHDLAVTRSSKSNNSFVIRKIAMENPEGYQIRITSNVCEISASTHAGVFYALQTLRQLWLQSKALPSLTINDYPRFKYRGVMLDVSRHYFQMSELKQFIDLLAAQKLNTLHIHFADDEAWRLDVSRNHSDSLYRLVSRGSNRGLNAKTPLPPALLTQANLDISNRVNFSTAGKLLLPRYVSADKQYSGYYNAADIKHLIAYANDRQITIIPEIDLPGHARALIYALPEVFHDSNDKSLYHSVQFFTDNVVSVCLYQNSANGKAFTAKINLIAARIHNMFSDQTTLYHRDDVSLAGDEVAPQAWSQDDSCIGKWKDLSALSKTHYFFSLLPATGLLSGWQQVVQNDDGSIDSNSLPPQRLGHVWVWEVTGNEGKRKGIIDAAALVNAGYPTVLAFADDTYLDLSYSADKWEPGFRWAGSYLDTHATLRSAFDAYQTEQFIHADQQHNLLGIEGALWSENVTTMAHLIYTGVPKMTGLAEASWSSMQATTNAAGNLNWQSLAFRLGSDNKGFLGYLFQISHTKYRGYPRGITAEIPRTEKQS